MATYLEGMGIVGLGGVAPGYYWFLRCAIDGRSLWENFMFISGVSSRLLCSLMQGVLHMLCRLPLAGDPVQQQGCASSRVEMFIHSTCTESYLLGIWLKRCAVQVKICAMGVHLVLHLFCFLEDRKVFIILSIQNSMSVMWHAPRFNQQSPFVSRALL